MSRILFKGKTSGIVIEQDKSFIIVHYGNELGRETFKTLKEAKEKLKI